MHSRGRNNAGAHLLQQIGVLDAQLEIGADAVVRKATARERPIEGEVGLVRVRRFSDGGDLGEVSDQWDERLARHTLRAVVPNEAQRSHEEDVGELDEDSERCKADEPRSIVSSHRGACVAAAGLRCGI